MRENYLFVNVPPGLNKDTHDFFEWNPELRYFDCINKLVKSVGPMTASNIMWAVYLVLDPDSKFYAERLESRKKHIADNFLKIPDFDWDSIDYVMSCYPGISMSPAKSDYYRVRSLFNKLLDDAEGYESAEAQAFLSKLSSIYIGIDKSETRMVKEKGKATEVKGSQQPGKFAKSRKT